MTTVKIGDVRNVELVFYYVMIKTVWKCFTKREMVHVPYVPRDMTGS